MGRVAESASFLLLNPFLQIGCSCCRGKIFYSNPLSLAIQQYLVQVDLGLTAKIVVSSGS